MILSYQGVTVEELSSLNSIEAYRNHLFANYIRRMLERRRVTGNYSSQIIIPRLVWLAQNMIRHSQTLFLIEQMQPSFIFNSSQRWLHAVIVSLIIGSINSLVGIFIGRSFGGWIFWVISGVFGGIIGLYISRYSKLILYEVLVWSWKRAWGGFLRGVAVGLLFGFIGGLMIGLVIGFNLGWVGLFFYGIIFGFLCGVISALSFGLLGGLIWGMGSLKPEKKSTPNQGIWMSARNTIIMGLAFGISVWLSVGLVLWPIFGLTVGIRLGTILGCCFGLVSGFAMGGQAFINHFILRLIFWGTGQIPWNLTRFLDYATEKIFLRKVGGGYIFIHRYLMEYFASLTPEDIERLSNEIESKKAQPV